MALGASGSPPRIVGGSLAASPLGYPIAEGCRTETSRHGPAVYGRYDCRTTNSVALSLPCGMLQICAVPPVLNENRIGEAAPRTCRLRERSDWIRVPWTTHRDRGQGGASAGTLRRAPIYGSARARGQVRPSAVEEPGGGTLFELSLGKPTEGPPTPAASAVRFRDRRRITFLAPSDV